ncbi:MAG: TonB-dependent receptor, partial [Pseudomonadota bacterium]
VLDRQIVVQAIFDMQCAAICFRLIPGLASGAPVLDDVFDSRGGITGENEAEAFGGALHIEYRLNDNWTIKNILSYREDDSTQQIDFETLPAIDVDVPVIYENEQLTEEFQVLYEGDAIAGVAGVYYIDANAFNTFDVLLDVALPGLNANTTGDVDTSSWAIFGDFTLDLESLVGLPGFELAFGGRYTSDRREATVLRQTFFTGRTPAFGGIDAPPVAVTSDFTGEERFTDFSPRISLSWSPNDDHTLYASYSQGFKGGGFDPRGQSNTVREDFPGDTVALDVDGDGDLDEDDVFDFFLFEPEEVDSYELGWKSSLLGGRLTSNLAAFYAEYTNVQIPGSQGAIDPVTNLQTFVGVTTNAGEAEFFGIEWEGGAQLASDIATSGDNLAITWGAGWLDAEYTEFETGNPPQDVSDLRVVQNTPEWSGALTTNYSRPLNVFGQLGELALITVSSWKSLTHQFEVPNEFLDQKAYALFDASLVWTSDDARIQAGVHGKNLTDKEYIVAGYDFLARTADNGFVQPLTPTLGTEGIQTAFFGPPRTVVGTVEFRF